MNSHYQKFMLVDKHLVRFMKDKNQQKTGVLHNHEEGSKIWITEGQGSEILFNTGFIDHSYKPVTGSLSNQAINLMHSFWDDGIHQLLQCKQVTLNCKKFSEKNKCI